MPKLPHTNIVSLVQRTIGKYYELVDQDPKIRVKHEEHLKEIEALNKWYLKELNYCDAAKEFEVLDHYPGLFKVHIDFLTGVYTKEEQLHARERLREKLRNTPNRHYKPHG